MHRVPLLIASNRPHAVKCSFIYFAATVNVDLQSVDLLYVSYMYIHVHCNNVVRYEQFRGFRSGPERHYE